jgi:hypothetical protein
MQKMNYDILSMRINFSCSKQIFIDVYVYDLKDWTIEHDIYQG